MRSAFASHSPAETCGIPPHSCTPSRASRPRGAFDAISEVGTALVQIAGFLVFGLAIAVLALLALATASCSTPSVFSRPPARSSSGEDPWIAPLKNAGAGLAAPTWTNDEVSEHEAQFLELANNADARAARAEHQLQRIATVVGWFGGVCFAVGLGLFVLSFFLPVLDRKACAGCFAGAPLCWAMQYWITRWGSQMFTVTGIVIVVVLLVVGALFLWPFLVALWRRAMLSTAKRLVEQGDIRPAVALVSQAIPKVNGGGERKSLVDILTKDAQVTQGGTLRPMKQLKTAIAEALVRPAAAG